jgi:hypothetical protein
VLSIPNGVLSRDRIGRTEPDVLPGCLLYVQHVRMNDVATEQINIKVILRRWVIKEIHRDNSVGFNSQHRILIQISAITHYCQR